ncbi:Acyl-protein synthetase, LuxE [Tenacibaculum mesophilum]|uniref:Acyl transferase n=1 Tax=Tenacibaculum mesophilum TaxID=104268 RepID=A0AAE9MPE7_9FLAO|nr:MULTISPECIES: acyl transferase [Tenacibaculum]GFD76932.1 acyltransferase [Tenacibaculum sp. KUL113]AZJ33007.1 acyl transferase [Tenacibaculum mesophilum]MCO7184172.1 acyl transferase [Tenacibaculum sp. XPcli2-G]QFS28257.1 acyl transferase [Tenacibaculum mesophilum]UTD15714.1 acyl transferase [Tenacibaculum mesophilum]
MKNTIFNIQSTEDFNKTALQVFKHQFTNNKVYRSFCDLIYVHPSDVHTIEQIPFLPIQFFKTREVLSSTNEIQETFTSSGTTGSTTSKHLVTDLSWYETSYLKGFEHFYGNIEDYVVLALLPNYLERKGSSLIYMVEDLIKRSQHPESGFYLNNLDELAQKLTNLDSQGKKVLLIGVSFALLDLVEQYEFNLSNTIIMETGGMKGRRKELIRNELHAILSNGFGVNEIHSEYGMTELLSQGYSKGNGVFNCPPWMQVLTRDTEDALTILPKGKSGGINVIDLANYNSCSFIATQDLGKVYQDNSFEIIGRFDNSDIRGCNLMVL